MSSLDVSHQLRIEEDNFPIPTQRHGPPVREALLSVQQITKIERVPPDLIFQRIIYGR